MKLSDFDFELPRELIARFPAEKRDESRLMVVERQSGRIEHRVFGDFADRIDRDSFLVINNTRVLPARLLGHCGGREVDMLVVRWLPPDLGEVLARPARSLGIGAHVSFSGGLNAEVVEIGQRGRRVMKFSGSRDEVLRRGYAPLPPYIKRRPDEASRFRDFDLERYQTVYSRLPGSVAAPTAGLHFTPEILSRLREKTEVVEITLEVGEATFQKIERENIEDHRMGTERIVIEKEKIGEIRRLRNGGKKLLAVGTTSVRALESYACFRPAEAEFESDLFISPGFRFQLVDRLLTNFHLPQSSLFILVAAFIGLDLAQKAYREAVENRYRFFSYGDAMLIL